jgi:uncharacterized damage-inducible protein DinB
MSCVLADRFRRWFAYEKDSHAQVLASLRSVPAEGQATQPFRKAVTLLGHLVGARRMWLFRLGQSKLTEETARGFALEDEDANLSEMADRLDSMHAEWSAYLERLDDADLARVFAYRSWEGDWYQGTVEDVLTQMFGHSWYHRGQIASLVRQAGGQPAATDFIFWSREPIAPPAAPTC